MAIGIINLFVQFFERDLIHPIGDSIQIIVCCEWKKVTEAAIAAVFAEMMIGEYFVTVATLPFSLGIPSPSITTINLAR